MEHLWIVLILVSAALQTARNAGQKHLGARLSALTATWVRFGFGLPFALIYLFCVLHWFDVEVPELGSGFLIPALLAGMLQISSTVLLVLLFRMRNFAIGSTYVRTETIIAAILGSLFFGEVIDFFGWFAITISVVGVIIISLVRSGIKGITLIGSFFDISAVIGLLSGFGFALGSFFIRQASLSFGHPNFALTASLTLVTIITLQTVFLGGFILIWKPKDFIAIGKLWKPSLFVGITSAFGSIGWFTAMTIQRVAYVKVIAQVEFLFALAVSIMFFGERPTFREVIGMLMIAIGILVLLLFAN